MTTAKSEKAKGNEQQKQQQSKCSTNTHKRPHRLHCCCCYCRGVSELANMARTCALALELENRQTERGRASGAHQVCDVIKQKQNQSASFLVSLFESFSARARGRGFCVGDLRQRRRQRCQRRPTVCCFVVVVVVRRARPNTVAYLTGQRAGEASRNSGKVSRGRGEGQPPPVRVQLQLPAEALLRLFGDKRRPDEVSSTHYAYA